MKTKGNENQLHEEAKFKELKKKHTTSKNCPNCLTKTGSRRKRKSYRPIMSKKTESVILKLEQIKSPGSDGVTGEFYQTFKGKLT